jgi:hypothetical protein
MTILALKKKNIRVVGMGVCLPLRVTAVTTAVTILLSLRYLRSIFLCSFVVTFSAPPSSVCFSICILYFSIIHKHEFIERVDALALGWKETDCTKNSKGVHLQDSCACRHAETRIERQSVSIGGNRRGCEEEEQKVQREVLGIESRSSEHEMISVGKQSRGKRERNGRVWGDESRSERERAGYKRTPDGEVRYRKIHKGYEKGTRSKGSSG